MLRIHLTRERGLYGVYLIILLDKEMITYLDKPWFLVLILLVHVQLDQVHVEVQGLDAHQHGSAVRGSW